MKKIHLILSSVITIFSINGFSQTEKNTGPLTFHVTGFEDNSGQTILMLYRPEDDVPKKPFIRINAEIVNRESVIPVKDLPCGDYAAIIVHDKNKNEIIDHKWGIPAEPLGYTNNWRLSLISGMPNFEKLKFHYSSSNKLILVRMKD
ncbi:MAG: DUF2141 domain-containing protein [Bacteroidetes bacterium]|nr:DUF2141 domain-containing protein [Bacteroidota bacterium]